MMMLFLIDISATNTTVNHSYTTHTR